ncbi:hypothetical protein ONZ45_g10593 [Pleurotus djamor]|nr:hypothetical protein ONZ45_g10593 [Pleurotus djamor]
MAKGKKKQAAGQESNGGGSGPWVQRNPKFLPLLLGQAAAWKAAGSALGGRTQIETEMAETLFRIASEDEDGETLKMVESEGWLAKVSPSFLLRDAPAQPRKILKKVYNFYKNHWQAIDKALPHDGAVPKTQKEGFEVPPKITGPQYAAIALKSRYDDIVKQYKEGTHENSAAWNSGIRSAPLDLHRLATGSLWKTLTDEQREKYSVLASDTNKKGPDDDVKAVIAGKKGPHALARAVEYLQDQYGMTVFIAASYLDGHGYLQTHTVESNHPVKPSEKMGFEAKDSFMKSWAKLVEPTLVQDPAELTTDHRLNFGDDGDVHVPTPEMGFSRKEMGANVAAYAKAICALQIGGKNVPWKRVAENPGKFLDLACLPEGIKFCKPSDMYLHDLQALLKHWREREKEGLVPLIFKVQVEEDAPESSKQAPKRGMKEGTSKARRRAAALNNEEGEFVDLDNVLASSDDEDSAPPTLRPQKGSKPSIAESGGSAKDSEKVKGKRKAVDEYPDDDDTTLGNDSGVTPPPQKRLKSPADSYDGGETDLVISAEGGSRALDLEGEGQMDVDEYTEHPPLQPGAFVQRRSPSDVPQDEGSRFSFLQSLSDEKDYVTLLNCLREWKAGNVGGGSKGTPAPPFGQWNYQGLWCSEGFYSAGGYSAYLDYLLGNPHIGLRGTLGVRQAVETMLLSIGMVLRDFKFVCFSSNDPDSFEESGAPQYVNNYDFGMDQHQEMLGHCQRLYKVYKRPELFPRLFVSSPESSPGTELVACARELPNFKLLLPLCGFLQADCTRIGAHWVKLLNAFAKVEAANPSLPKHRRLTPFEDLPEVVLKWISSTLNGEDYNEATIYEDAEASTRIGAWLRHHMKRTQEKLANSPKSTWKDVDPPFLRPGATGMLITIWMAKIWGLSIAYNNIDRRSKTGVFQQHKDFVLAMESLLAPPEKKQAPDTKKSKKALDDLMLAMDAEMDGSSTDPSTVQAGPSSNAPPENAGPTRGRGRKSKQKVNPSVSQVDSAADVIETQPKGRAGRKKPSSTVADDGAGADKEPQRKIMPSRSATKPDYAERLQAAGGKKTASKKSKA